MIRWIIFPTQGRFRAAIPAPTPSGHRRRKPPPSIAHLITPGATSPSCVSTVI